MHAITDFFQETAYRMGYKPEDLLPITRQDVEYDSQNFTKGMTEKEKDYYLNKKMVTLMQRQNKIIAQVEKQIKKKDFYYRLSGDHKHQLQNPNIQKILVQHQKIIQNNIKYLDTLFRKKELDRSRNQRISISSNSNARRSDRSFRTNESAISKRSNKSAQSSQSNRSTASNKQRLLMVREKQKQKQRLMKEVYKQKQLQNSKKALKAEEEIMKKSQRVKTKSQINRQIVAQNKKDRNSLQKTQIKHHFQQMKYKLQKTEQIRVNHAVKRLERYQKNDYRQFKKLIEDEKATITANRIFEKVKSTALRIQNQDLIRKQAKMYNKLTDDLKSSTAKKNRQMQAKRDEMYLVALRKNEQKRLQTAQLNRSYQTEQMRLGHINRDVKFEVAKKNIQSAGNRRYLQSEDISRKLKNRFEEISQIQMIKKTLHRQRGKIVKDISLQKRSLQLGEYRPKFNSFIEK